MMRLAPLLLVLLPTLAAAQTAQCPGRLPDGAVEVTRAPAGWLATSPGPLRLDGGGMLSVNPRQMQYLVPATTQKTKGGKASMWRFDPGEEKWLYCTYGTMAVQLSKRMDDAATACEVTVRKEPSGAIAEIAAVCR